jgi:hypothetical protein
LFSLVLSSVIVILLPNNYNYTIFGELTNENSSFT